MRSYIRTLLRIADVRMDVIEGFNHQRNAAVALSPRKEQPGSCCAVQNKNNGVSRSFWNFPGLREEGLQEFISRSYEYV